MNKADSEILNVRDGKKCIRGIIIMIVIRLSFWKKKREKHEDGNVETDWCGVVICPDVMVGEGG